MPFIVLLALVASPMATAKPVESPSRTLRDAWTMVVSADASGTRVEGHTAQLVLDQVVTLHGKPAASGTLQIRSPRWVLDRIVEGERLIVAYTVYQRDPTLPDRRMIDPAGPQMLFSDGLQPAVFRDDETTRGRLFDASGALREGSLDEVLEGLRSADPQWQNYYAHELALRPDLRHAWNGRTRAAVERVLRDVDAHPSARGTLFRAAARMDDSSPGIARWQSAAIDALRAHPTDLPSGDEHLSAELIRTVFDLLHAAEIPIDEQTLSRWVDNASPALVERALLGIRRSAPDRETVLIERALDQSLLPAGTRAFLLDHKRRLGIMREALAERRAKSR